MLTYNDLYECLRKEKYSEQLQSLPKNFVQEFSDYMSEMRKKFSDFSGERDFLDETLKEKKQYENAISIFKETMLRRKKKILNLVFVATETGIMKRDFTDMLPFERDAFEKIIRAVDDSDKVLSELLNGKPLKNMNKMVLIKEDIEEFVGMGGEIIGPYKKGVLANLDSQIAEILVSDGKATLVDEE